MCILRFHKRVILQGIHSQEALELVKSHVRSLMGPAVMHHDSSVIKLPKLQAVQVHSTYLYMSSLL